MLALAAAALLALPPSQPVVGTWEGLLKAGPIELRLVFKVAAEGEGLAAKLDSPDQGAKDIPFTKAAFADNKLSLELGKSATFAGTLDGDKLKGDWKQSGQTFPLELKRVEKVAPLNRPQTPRPPFPYKAEDVTFPSAADGVTLAGTLTTPPGDGPFPAAVLVSGSGPQDRDETLFEHKPFLVLADHLARKGVAVLRFDDRGVGKSTGKFKDATTADFAQDALGAVRFLKGRPGVDPRRVGVIGHSEGGLIAPMVAADSPDVGFVVLLAGPGLPGDELAASQSGTFARSMGSSEREAVVVARISTKLVAVAKGDLTGDALVERMKAVLREEAAKLDDADRKGWEEKALKEAEAGLAGRLSDPWMRWFIRFDPRPTLARVRCPVLALTGEKDVQVDARENLPAIEKAVRSGGNGRVTVRELAGLNHLFQPAKTGALSEYGKIEETFAPAALEAVSSWVLGLK